MTLSYPLDLADWFDQLPIGRAEPPRLDQALVMSRTEGGEVVVGLHGPRKLGHGPGGGNELRERPHHLVPNGLHDGPIILFNYVRHCVENTSHNISGLVVAILLEKSRAIADVGEADGKLGGAGHQGRSASPRG